MTATTLRVGPPDDALAGHLGWAPLVASWFGGQVTALEVPVVSGMVTQDASRPVTRSLEMRVPRFSVVDDVDGPRRQDWLPPGDDPSHPLERFGQELTVAIETTSPLRGTTTWITSQGRFAIQSAIEEDDGSVVVSAAGRTQIIVDDGLTEPIAPRASGTFASEFDRLLPPGFVVTIDDSLVDRPIPQSLEWADDRMAALESIAAAWPARLREDDDGNLLLLPPLPAAISPEVTLTDGEGGTVVSAPRTTTRAGTYNVVVARGEETEDGRPPVSAVARREHGPLAVATYNAVTAYYASPLLTTKEQCQAAATTRLGNLLRPARTITVTHAPDPRITIDTAVRVRRGGRTWLGSVVGTEIPLTVHDGEQTTIVGIG